MVGLMTGNINFPQIKGVKKKIIIINQNDLIIYLVNWKNATEPRLTILLNANDWDLWVESRAHTSSYFWGGAACIEFILRKNIDVNELINFSIPDGLVFITLFISFHSFIFFFHFLAMIGLSTEKMAGKSEHWVWLILDISTKCVWYYISLSLFSICHRWQLTNDKFNSHFRNNVNTLCALRLLFFCSFKIRL